MGFMISIRRTVIAAAMLAAVSSSAFAQMSATYADWAKGPAQFLMTSEEQATWKKVKSDADAKAFVDLFWAKRDPSPATPNVNEFQIEFDRRVKAADDTFTTPRKKGSVSERGKYLIVLGPPTRIAQAKPGMEASPSTAAGTESSGMPAQFQPRQVWTYEKGKVDFETGRGNLEVNFVDQYNNGEWMLERGGEASNLAKKLVAAAVKNPNLTEVPKAAPAAAAPVPAPVALPTAPVATVDATGTIKTEALRSAITEFKAAKTNPYKGGMITFTELVAPSGDAYIPVQLYIPKSAGLTAESVTTFFGTVEDSTGAPVLMFEEPATLSTSMGDLYFDKAIKLKPGSYKATLGLSGADSKPVVMSSGAMEVKDFNKDTIGVSRLVVAGDMHETEKAAVVGSPYAFGKLKIVPKGNRIFSNRDEISYFVEIFNPGIDDASSLPKIQIKLELAGAGKGKTPGNTISAPLSDASPLPLSGASGPGQYALIGSIPLGEMKNALPAGDYTLRLKVYDQVKKQNYTVEQPLTLTSAPAAAAPAK
jgi:GWxTD domain-containing protein